MVVEIKKDDHDHKMVDKPVPAEKPAVKTEVPLVEMDMKVEEKPKKFIGMNEWGNLPSNPMPATGLDMDPKLATVELYRDHPGAPDIVKIMVHPDMVGDYLRAGWSKETHVTPVIGEHMPEHKKIV